MDGVNAPDAVTRLDLPWLPDATAPAPVVWQDDYRAVVVYRAAPTDEGPMVVLEFGGVLAATFGYPGEEARGGDPLAARGLEGHGIHEVRNSSWLERLKQENLAVFPDAVWWPNDALVPGRAIRHFVVTFPEGTFACLARSIQGRFTAETVIEVLSPFMEAGRQP